MAFGNPYGEDYHIDLVNELVSKLNRSKISIVALSDTTGVSNPDNISPLFSSLISEYSSIEFGDHFHSTFDLWFEKVNAAYKNGCKRFDSALMGYGGCPMAHDVLVGNLQTEKLADCFKSQLDINFVELSKAISIAK